MSILGNGLHTSSLGERTDAQSGRTLGLSTTVAQVLHCEGGTQWGGAICEANGGGVWSQYETLCVHPEGSITLQLVHTGLVYKIVAGLQVWFHYHQSWNTWQSVHACTRSKCIIYTCDIVLKCFVNTTLKHNNKKTFERAAVCKSTLKQYSSEVCTHT